MYTLKMRAPGFPAEKPEYKEMIQREVERLAQKGYVVRVVDDPPTSPDGLFRQVIHVSMEIPNLHRIREFGVEEFFGAPCPNYIGIVFHDALWFRPRWIREAGEIEWEHNPGKPWQTTTYHESGTNSPAAFTWKLEADSTVRTVEVGGLSMVKPEELFTFYEVLLRVERKLRTGRKLSQLVGLAKAGNWDGIERLRREILDQVFTLL